MSYDTTAHIAIAAPTACGKYDTSDTLGTAGTNGMPHMRARESCADVMGMPTCTHGSSHALASAAGHWGTIARRPAAQTQRAGGAPHPGEAKSSCRIGSSCS